VQTLPSPCPLLLLLLLPASSITVYTGADAENW
jgi:hypothetical protein